MSSSPFQGMALLRREDYQAQLNRQPLYDGLSREQKLAYATDHLEQHEQGMK